MFNTLRPRQYCRYFADDIFKCIFMNENIWILIKISLKIIPRVRINNISALVQIMAWRRQGDKPLSEPMMVSSLTHICVIRPQWISNILLVCIRHFCAGVADPILVERINRIHKELDQCCRLDCLHHSVFNCGHIWWMPCTKGTLLITNYRPPNRVDIAGKACKIFNKFQSFWGWNYQIKHKHTTIKRDIHLPFFASDFI